MNIYAKKGTKVTVTEQSINNGHDTDIAHARQYLKPGNIYTVERTDVRGWSSDVYLQEFPGIYIMERKTHRSLADGM